jgi:hypothetical protein
MQIAVLLSGREVGPPHQPDHRVSMAAKALIGVQVESFRHGGRALARVRAGTLLPGRHRFGTYMGFLCASCVRRDLPGLPC